MRRDRCRRPGSAAAFTLLELIVAIVILSVLAGITVAAANAVTRRAQRSSTEQTLVSVIREAQVLAAADDSPITDAHLAAAVADLGPSAGIVGHLEGDAGSPMASGSFGQLLYFAWEGSAGVAMVDPSGTSCILARTDSPTGEVDAWSSEGDCTASAAIDGPAFATIPLTAPPPPTDVVATALGGGDVEVSFSGDGAAVSFVVTVSPGGATVTVGDSPALVSSLTPGETYTFSVVAIGAGSIASESSAPSAPVVAA